jgi:hypothetical protein
VTGHPPPDVYGTVDLEAGLWAVAGVVLLALILLTALRPALRRRRKEDRVCRERGSLGAHPLGEPDEAGVRRCGCGVRTQIPAGSAARVDGATFTVTAGHVGTPIDVLAPRTDTREHRWPGDTGELLELWPRTADPDAPTDEAPLPHVVWSKR